MGCASSTPEDKHVGFDGVSVGSGHRSKSSDDLAHGFKKDAAALSEALEQELRSFFDAMDGAARPSWLVCCCWTFSLTTDDLRTPTTADLLTPTTADLLTPTTAARLCARAGDKNGEVSKDEAIAFWGKNFAKVNATAMFNEVDEDKSATITWDEFLAFWRNVVASGYSEDDLKEEVEMMKAGGSWVDFNDGRTT
jgi:hypothetical protein